MDTYKTGHNPIIWSDFPDLDVIRVEDTYYMVSTTMHMMPGCVLLRSYDLINWEIASYVYTQLEGNTAHNLEEGAIYGKGMWAASLRYHRGIFYICFVANDTGKTYLYMSNAIEGVWKRQEVEGFYHDCSLLFEEDRTFIVYGNTQIYLTELNESLTGPKKNGIHKCIIEDTDDVGLGYEGAHFYKIEDKYYIFLIHWPRYGHKRRVEVCFVADHVEGPYVGKTILDDDLGYYNAGVAQGGIIDTPEGEWYAMLFQDHGAVGRIPVLVPMTWEEGFPVLGKAGVVPKQVTTKSTKPAYVYTPFVDSDPLDYTPDASGQVSLRPIWQWNHNPNPKGYSLTERPGFLRLRTQKVTRDILASQNTLTQRTVGPTCDMDVILDGRGLQDGDVAGLVALQGCYGYIGLTKEKGQYYIVMFSKKASKEALCCGRQPVGEQVQLKVCFDFRDNRDTAQFYYKEQEGEQWHPIGEKHTLYFHLDHFMGCRIGLFMFSQYACGGYADFQKFHYTIEA